MSGPTSLEISSGIDTDVRTVAAAESGAPPAINLCTTCHTGEVAPQIPFGNPADLALRLGGGTYLRGRLLDEVLYRLSDAAGTDRMPRGRLLSAEQVKALRSYFMGLENTSHQE